ncbi:Hpt domain-containing protein [Pseudoroseomonas cervicalis]
MNALDPDIARQLAEDLPPEVFLRLLRTFETDLARLAREMREAAAAGDLEGYRRGAHGLAGAAGAIGARGLEAVCREAMRPAAPLPPPSMLPRLDQEASQTLAELAVLVARHGG